VAGVVLGLGEPRGNDPMDRPEIAVGQLASALPGGLYHLAEPALDAELAAIAWGLGAYRFRRYKMSSGAAGVRETAAQLKVPECADYARAAAVVDGVWLARDLINTPASDMGPQHLEEATRLFGKSHGAEVTSFVGHELRTGNFPMIHAVGRASDRPPRLIDLTWGNPSARKVTLVGKGICFDTGGHNLKPAKYMAGMHEDMNGSAVAVGILLAATRAKLPVAIDCWLAVAQNHISPRAYKQNDIVTALNGTTIEIVHTDAEGRMVLSDTLTLAAREKPDLMLAFATLTGSMHVALGDRYSGIFVTSDDLARQALAAAVASGERVCVFPMDDDYDQALESPVADVKQCTLEGGADHILAARLLKRFTDDRPWIHMDLSGSSCKGGLGAVATDVTGFGVAWGHALLESLVRA
jgi:leucyl aminopeptidase